MCSQLYCEQIILFTGPAHVCFAIFISSFCHANSLPKNPTAICGFKLASLSGCRFPWRLLFHVFVAKPLDTLERWYHSVLIACWWKCTFLSQGISYPEAARMTLDIGHCYHLLLHTVDHLSRCAVILHSRHATCFLWLCWISSHLHLHLSDHNQSILI